MIKAGTTAYSEVFERNVDIVRVYASTATIRVWGGGLKANKMMTFRGHELTKLKERMK